PLDHAAVASAALGNLQLDRLAFDPRGLAGGDAEGINEPVDLAAGVADRLARLDAKRQRQLLVALAEAAHAVLEHLASRVRGARLHRRAGAIGSRDRLANSRPVGERGAGGDAPGVLVAYLKVRIRRDRLAGEVIGVAGGKAAAHALGG